MLKTIQRIF